MQPFRFIHCGDLHLGAPFQYAMGMSRHVDRAVAEATYEAFNNIIEIAVRERVNAVVISGDVYNSEDHNIGSGPICTCHVSLVGGAYSRIYGAR